MGGASAPVLSSIDMPAWIAFVSKCIGGAYRSADAIRRAKSPPLHYYYGSRPLLQPLAEIPHVLKATKMLANAVSTWTLSSTSNWN